MISANFFVKTLKSLAPKEDNLRSQGLDDEDIFEIVSSYNIIKINNDKLTTENPILDLIHQYDLKNMEVGEITFSNEIKYIDEHIYFGNSESNIILINAQTGFIEVRDREDYSFIMYTCASSPSNFLESILKVSYYLTLALVDDSSIYLAAKDCTLLSGCNESMNYYLTLLGYQTN